MTRLSRRVHLHTCKDGDSVLLPIEDPYSDWKCDMCKALMPILECIADDVWKSNVQIPPPGFEVKVDGLDMAEISFLRSKHNSICFPPVLESRESLITGSNMQGSGSGVRGSAVFAADQGTLTLTWREPFTSLYEWKQVLQLWPAVPQAFPTMFSMYGFLWMLRIDPSYMFCTGPPFLRTVKSLQT